MKTKIIHNIKNDNTYVGIYKIVYKFPFTFKQRECCYLCKNQLHPENGFVTMGIDVKLSNITEHYFVCGLCNKLVNK